MDIVEIQGNIKEYEWGNDSFIPQLLSQQIDGKPKAELWFGTHESGDSSVVGAGKPLSEFLRSDSLHWLGKEHLDSFSAELPLLLKVLAIEKPLSIQCHPSKAQAEEGWKKEALLRNRLPRDQWNYKDANRKAEVIYALTPITAMCGFRPLEQILGALQMLLPNSFAATFPYLLQDTHKPDDLIKQLFEHLYTMPKSELSALVEEYIAALAAHEELPLTTGDGTFLESKGIVISCHESYPADPGLFAPYLLNVVHLQPGQALYLEPRTLHAYVFGNGIELMSASDNVLRGGLTHKKVDVAELMHVMEVKGRTVQPVPILKGRSGRLHVLTPTEEFHLMILGPGTYNIDQRLSIELLFCTEGGATFTSSGKSVSLAKGSCHVVAASLESYTLEVQGTVCIADVPR